MFNLALYMYQLKAEEGADVGSAHTSCLYVCDSPLVSLRAVATPTEGDKERRHRC